MLTTLKNFLMIEHFRSKFYTFLASLLLLSCNELPCEKYGYGSVTIENRSQHEIVVDMTRPSVHNTERVLLPNELVTYEYISPGWVTIWYRIKIQNSII
jgi:hypothetical protein